MIAGSDLTVDLSGSDDFANTNAMAIAAGRTLHFVNGGTFRQQGTMTGGTLRLVGSAGELTSNLSGMDVKLERNTVKGSGPLPVGYEGRAGALVRNGS